jgi:hypothetical protein
MQRTLDGFIEAGMIVAGNFTELSTLDSPSEPS